MMPPSALLPVCAGVAAAGILTALLLALRLRRLGRQLHTQAGAATASQAASPDTFSPLLRQAELQARLHQDRPARQMPEKYRHLRILAEHGVPSETIAQMLKLPPGEVTQLLALALVAKGRPAARSPKQKRSGATQKAKVCAAAAETLQQGSKVSSRRRSTSARSA